MLSMYSCFMMDVEKRQNRLMALNKQTGMQFRNFFANAFAFV